MNLNTWLQAQGIAIAPVPLAGDASARRYYRLQGEGVSYIAMDASRLKESVAPFVRLNKTLAAAGVHVPRIYAYDIEQGFVLLEDFGDTALADRLEEDKEAYYRKALDTLAMLQRAESDGLPPYDETFLRFEMGLMDEWYLEKYLQIPIDASTRRMLNATYDTLTREVLSQPQGIFVHRDYHSRNLMLPPDGSLGVIDYQDARSGALTYDAVSLLRDVYVDNDEATVHDLALYFRDKVGAEADDATFMRWFDMTGLQRHIKILGVFARLALRDGKRSYLDDIPQTLRYITRVCTCYDELEAFGNWIELEVI